MHYFELNFNVEMCQIQIVDFFRSNVCNLVVMNTLEDAFGRRGGKIYLLLT